MSASNFYDSMALDCRGKRNGVKGFFTMPAGVKKAVKRTLHRNVRQTEARALDAELASFDQVALADLSPDELSALADQFWGESISDPGYEDGDEALFAELDALTAANEAELDLPFEVSLAEYAGLPDWMITQMESTGGSTMELLSLLEAKPAAHRNRAKMFAVVNEDEGYFEE